MEDQKNRLLTDDGGLSKFINTRSSNMDKLLEFVKNHIDKGSESIALCFRGDNICLYYRCHKLLQIKAVYSRIVGEFSFRHSRFTEQYKTKEKELRELGVENLNEDNGYETLARFYFDKDTPQKLFKILDIYKGLIDDFVNPTMYVYQWKGPHDKPEPKTEKKNKSANLEKDVQQKIYSDWFQNDQAMIYDIEYIEHRGSDYGVKGRIDLLGLVNEGNQTYLEFIELKSTPWACVDSNAGVESHLVEYKKYVGVNELIEQRKQEAVATVEQLQKLFPDLIKFKPISDEIQVRIRFIFSHEAKQYRYLAEGQGVEITEI